MNFDMRNFLTPKRVTNAMWDYSWLTGHHAGGPYEDFDKVTDELLERGFNTVRIDCFPWLAGHLASGEHDGVVTMPANPLATWGLSLIEQKHNILDEVLEFVSLAKQKKLYVILSNWWYCSNEYSQGAASMAFESAYSVLNKGWEAILDMLKANNLFDCILFCDIDQEFPISGPCLARLNELADDVRPFLCGDNDTFSSVFDVRHDIRKLVWNSRQSEFAAKVFQDSLAHFQSRYPELRFTFSFAGNMEEIRALGLNVFDVLELHYWIRRPRFENRTGYLGIPKFLRHIDYDYAPFTQKLDAALQSVRPMLLKEMENRLVYAASWGREWAAPLVVTEGWGPWWFGEQAPLKWDWLKEWCADCMGLAAQAGFWGVTPWNFAHPSFESWKDVAWYRKVNDAFLKS